MILAFRVPTIKNYESEKQITQRLVRFQGVDHVRVDVDSQFVRLIYDKSRTTPQDIKAALQEVGHDAEIPDLVVERKEIVEEPESEFLI